MTGQEIRERARLETIAFHYFYEEGMTMPLFPLLPFDAERYPDNHAKLQAAIEAEWEAGRLEHWDGPVYPEPFPQLREVLFRFERWRP